MAVTVSTDTTCTPFCITDRADPRPVDLTLIAIAVLLAGLAVALAERHRRACRAEHRERIVALLLTTVAPAVARAEPRELLAWQGAADAARQLFPEAVATIEARTGERFPFPQAVVEEAHAHWTAEWLAWERQHDSEYKERSAALEAELHAARADDAGTTMRARLAALDDEKLQTYQRRYEEYVRVGKGLIALIETAS